MNEQNLDFLFKNQDKLEKIETKIDDFIKQNLFINNCKKIEKYLIKLKN